MPLAIICNSFLGRACVSNQDIFCKLSDKVAIRGLNFALSISH